MFGLGSPKKAPVPAEKAPSRRRRHKPQQSRRISRKSQRAAHTSPPESPNSQSVIMSSESNVSVEGNHRAPSGGGGGFLSNWTSGGYDNNATVSPEESQSSEHCSEESSQSHSNDDDDDDDGDSCCSESSYDSEDSSSSSRSRSSSHSGSSHSSSETESPGSSLPAGETGSNLDSPRTRSAPTGSSRSSVRSPESSMQSSLIVSQESSLITPESSTLSSVTSRSSRGSRLSLTTTPSDKVEEKALYKFIDSPTQARSHSFDEAGQVEKKDGNSSLVTSTIQDRGSTLLLSTSDNDGAESEIKLTIATTGDAGSNPPISSTKHACELSHEMDVPLAHLAPPELATPNEKQYQEGKEQVCDDDDEDESEDHEFHQGDEEAYDDFDDYMADRHTQIFSGDEADDEMTMFSAGASTFIDQSVDPSQGMLITLNVDTSTLDLPETESLLLSPAEQSTYMENNAEGPSIGPNRTSSTLHSDATRKKKNKELFKQPMETVDDKGDTVASDVDSSTGMAEEASVLEIAQALKKAKGEYSTGPDLNRRYNPHLPSTSDDSFSQHDYISLPSFLDRNQIFHKSASAAVQALLTPSTNSELSEAGSNASKGRLLSVGSVGSSMECKFTPSSGPTSVFHTPKDGLNAGDDSMRPPLHRDFSKLISQKTERKLESLDSRMSDPSKTTKDLLVAIGTPDDRSKADLAFMIRRKNACGAIKVLTNDPKKRIKLCWTVGVLQALTSVLTDGLCEDGFMSHFDKRVISEYQAARDRAITTILNLSMPKENRLVVFHTPRLMHAMVYIIKEDCGPAARGCTAVLAYLAKSVENRLLMVQVPGLIEALVFVLHPRPPRVDQLGVRKKQSLANGGSLSSNDSHSESPRRRSSKNHSIAESEDSQKTLKITASQPPVELVGYDETAGAVVRGSRQNVFALIGHLSKEKDNAYHFARNTSLLQTMVQISTFLDSPAHVFAVRFLATLTRHRANTKLIVFQEREAVPALVKAANSESDETRLYACFAIQNMAQDKSCRQELAGCDGLVKTLCRRGRYAESEEERLSAIAAIKNLCDEPANLIPLTNTPECIATLMHLAHGREEGVTELMQYRACDALATLSHWLRKIATSGKALDRTQRGESMMPDQGLFVPSLSVVTWNQWQ